jgi:hypothetical protein
LKSYKKTFILLSFLSKNVYEVDEISAGTSPVEIGISPVESFEKPSLLTLLLSVKSKMPHILPVLNRNFVG